VPASEAHARQAPPAERAHNPLPPVLTRKAGSRDLFPIFRSDGPAHAWPRASCRRRICRLRFRASAGGHKGRVPRQARDQWHLPMPPRTGGWLRWHQETTGLCCAPTVPMGKRFGRWLLPDNRLLDIARGAPMNAQNSDIGDPAETLDWLVYRIGSPNMLLGSVIAPTLETALAAPGNA
jgi:hypothetical protein